MVLGKGGAVGLEDGSLWPQTQEVDGALLLVSGTFPVLFLQPPESLFITSQS